MLKKGIILIATGAPGYGNMAYNLALTIKLVEDIPIALVYTPAAVSHLNDAQKGIFSHHIPLPDNCPGGFGCKLHLDQLTPFAKTLYLDADMLWLSKTPTELFSELEGNAFRSIVEGTSDLPNNKYYFWADAEEIKKAYKLKVIPQVRSEVLYFEKGTKVFKQARLLKPEACLKTIRMFGDHIPDELYFNIACGQLEIDQPTGWMPAYWSRLNGEIMPKLSDLYMNYFLLSFGSNVASPVMKRTYDTVMQVVSNKLRLPYLFKLKSKKEWSPGRLKI